MSDRRGSLTTPARKGSKSRRNTASCSCSGPPPRSGPPEVIRRVGSPPVWESMMVKVFMMRMVDDTDGSVLHDVADFNDDFRIAWALEPHYDFFSRPSSSCRRSWWIWKRRLAGCKKIGRAHV